MGLKTETGSITLGDNTYTATKVYLDCEGGGGSGDKDMLQQRVDATNSCNRLFYQYTGDNVDYIANLDTSNVTSMSYMFYNSSKLTTIPILDTSKVTNMIYTFYGCSSLTAIPAFDVGNVTNMSNAFDNCTNIEEIHMINIGASLSISDCTKMERDALLEVLGNLKDLTGVITGRLSLGSTLLAKLTEEDKAIATNKNWVLA